MSYIGYNKRSGGSAKLRMEVVDGVIEEVDLKDVVFSNGSFQFPSYEQGGLPVDYNFIFGGLNFQSAEDAQEQLRDKAYLFKNVVCNAIKTLENGMQSLSLHYLRNNVLQSNDMFNHFFDNSLTHFYDVKGFFKNLQGRSVVTINTLKVLSLPGITAMPDLSFISEGGAHLAMPSLEHLHMPALASIGPTELEDGYLRYAPNYLAITVSKALETSNNGGIEGDLQYLIDNKFANVIFV